MNAYDLAKDYKLRTKLYHDRKIVTKHFTIGQKVLLYQTRLHLHPGKLRTRWTGPFTVTQVYDHGAIELLNPEDNTHFKVNGHRLKPFFELDVQDVEEADLVASRTKGRRPGHCVLPSRRLHLHEVFPLSLYPSLARAHLNPGFC